MGETRTDPITLARIAAVATRYTRTGTLTDEQRDQAITELAQLADGRTDLLAEHAGVALGFQDSCEGFHAAQLGLEVELCVQAGADLSQLEHWRVVGHERATRARQIPRTW